MNKIGSEKVKLRFIVLPFTPESAEQFNCVGLTLHFLLGNTIVLHTDLKEFWFGWRVKALFPEKKNLEAYCQGKGGQINFRQLCPEQGIRFWLCGHVDDHKINLSLFDGFEDDQANSAIISFSSEDHLVGFRKAFMHWLTDCGLPFPEKQKQRALWPEKISMEGMYILHQALQKFYVYSAYEHSNKIDLGLFKDAVAIAPESFMAQDLLAWAYYRNKDYKQAKIFFLRALLSNPNGIGAMSGLMWCSVFMNNKEDALYWASRKAGARMESIEDAKRKTLKRLKKCAKKI